MDIKGSRKTKIGQFDVNFSMLALALLKSSVGAKWVTIYLVGSRWALIWPWSYIIHVSLWSNASLVIPTACIFEKIPKVDVPNSNTKIIWSTIFEYYVVRCGSKNQYQKGTCLEEIGLCAQSMLTILVSIVDMIGGTCMTTSWTHEISLW